MYRLATTNDMMADVLQVGHKASVREFDRTTETVHSVDEWVMPSQSPMIHRCGHELYPGWSAVHVQEHLEDITAELPSPFYPMYATAWDFIAHTLTQRCDACTEAALDAQTTALEYMDDFGPREG